MSRFLSLLLSLIFLNGCIFTSKGEGVRPSTQDEEVIGYSFDSEAFDYVGTSPDEAFLDTPDKPGVLCEKGVKKADCPNELKVVAIGAVLADVQSALCSSNGEEVRGENLGVGPVNSEGYLSEAMRFNFNYFEPDVLLLVLSEDASEMNSVNLSRSVVDSGSVAYVVPGDYDKDGDVDEFDLAVWESNFGEEGVGIPGDNDFNGFVDGSDLISWQRFIGADIWERCPQP